MPPKQLKHKFLNKASSSQINSLKDKCLDVVVANFSQLAISKNIPRNLMPDIIKRLNYDIPPLVSLQYILDDDNDNYGNLHYWQNFCYKKFERYKCNIDEHGGSWKRMYFEKLISEKLETFEDDVNELGNSLENRDSYDNLLELLLLIESTSDIIQLLHFQQLPSHLDLSEVISKLPNLLKIDFKYSHKKIGMDYDRLQFGMKVSDASYLAQALPFCQNLTILKLSENLIDDDILRIVMTGVINNRSITTLDLSHNQIGNHGARYISKIIDGDNSILEHLDISNNKISTDGGKYLARSLRSGGKLRSLNLRLNRLHDEGCSLIMEGLLDNPYLLYLNISANNAENKVTNL
jgi:hypothetical protein